MFRAGSYLAVLAPDDDVADFWICYIKSDVLLENENISVAWLEQEATQANVFHKLKSYDRIPLESVICKVVVLRQKNEKTYKLPDTERIKVETVLEKIRTGFKINLYKNEKPKIEKESDDDDDDDEDKPLVSRKRKLQPKKKITKKEMKKKKQQKGGPKKKIKLEKKKIDKSNPNWRMKPNHDIEVWDQDPLFETRENVPFISSLAHSRLVHRAVILKDDKMLREVINNTKQVHSLNMVRCLGNRMSPLDYALKTGNMSAINILQDTKNHPKSKRVEQPICSISCHGTGSYNYR